MKKPEGAGAIFRALELLDLLTEAGRPLSIKEVSERQKLPPSTAYRLLRVLEAHGLVASKGETKLYSLGSKILQMAKVLVSESASIDLPTLARPVMEDILNQTGETIALYTMVGTWRLCLLELPSTHAIRMVAGAGNILPLEQGASGRILLGMLDDEERIAVLRRSQRPLAMSRSGSADYLAALQTARSQGYALSHSDMVPSGRAIAVPVFDQDGRCIAALNIGGPDHRFTEEVALGHVPILQAASRRITERLSTATAYLEGSGAIHKSNLGGKP